VERARHTSPLVVDGVEGRLDALLDAGADIVELVDYYTADILDEILSRFLRPPRTPRDNLTSLLAALWSEKERQSSANGEPDQEGANSSIAFFDNDVRSTVVRLVVIVLIVLVHSPSLRFVNASLA
jgi:hypothetical protein